MFDLVKLARHVFWQTLGKEFKPRHCPFIFFVLFRFVLMHLPGRITYKVSNFQTRKIKIKLRSKLCVWFWKTQFLKVFCNAERKVAIIPPSPQKYHLKNINMVGEPNSLQHKKPSQKYFLFKTKNIQGQSL